MNKICEEPQELIIDLSIIPVASTKIPYKGWKEFQSNLSPVVNWHSHYLNQGYVGIICGAVSGNIECIDIDIKNDPERTINNEYTNLIKSLINTLIIQKTPSGGLHIIYKCPEVTIDRSQKLALSKTGEVIIETRGEGGYFCTHLNDYILLKGQFDLKNLDIEIPTITKEQRDFLLESARSLTRYFPIKAKKEFSYKEPVINEFNETYDVIPLLEKNGLEVVNEDDEKYHLLRSGSTSTHSGYYFKDSRVFYCFSTSTEFKQEKPYNNFQILSLLEGNNDYRSTLKILDKLGYETSSKSEKLQPEVIAEFINDSDIYYNGFTQDIEIDGGLLDQRVYNTTYLNLKKHLDQEIPKNKFDDVINSTYINSVNPILDFIDKNSSKSASGIIDKWFSCIELKNPNINRNIALKYVIKWYVGLIAQALDGRFPNEFFLTFLSTEQGIGKTTLLRNYTIPIELQKYVSEHPLDFTEDFQVMMGQTLLIIDDEMDGNTWSKMNQFKSVLSTTNMTLRRKYDRRISLIKRRSSFAGSGNNLQVIKEHQNRRVIPIEIASIDFKKLEEINLTDMFIECYNLYKDGFEYSFQKSDFNNLKHLYADYVQKSDLDIIVDEYIQLPKNENDVFYISNLDIINSINQKFTHNNKKLNNVILGKMMAERGLVSIQKGKLRTTCYELSKLSKVLHLLETEAVSWNFNSGSTSDYLDMTITLNRENRRAC
ncbi:MAG: hypothetical protein JXR07_07680 [Reichenbachiella sp.]